MLKAVRIQLPIKFEEFDKPIVSSPLPENLKRLAVEFEALARVVLKRPVSIRLAIRSLKTTSGIISKDFLVKEATVSDDNLFIDAVALVESADRGAVVYLKNLVVDPEKESIGFTYVASNIQPQRREIIFEGSDVEVVDNPEFPFIVHYAGNDPEYMIRWGIGTQDTSKSVSYHSHYENLKLPFMVIDDTSLAMTILIKGLSKVLEEVKDFPDLAEDVVRVSAELAESGILKGEE